MTLPSPPPHCYQLHYDKSYRVAPEAFCPQPIFLTCQGDADVNSSSTTLTFLYPARLSPALASGRPPHSG